MAEDTASGRWVWLLPLTYLCHLAEEYWAVEPFYRWVARLGWTLSEPRFLVLNAVALVVMTAAVWASTRWRAAALAVPALSTAVTLNGLLHVAASVITVSYSPGLVTGLLLWLPLGSYGLRRSRAALPRHRFWTGVCVGLLGHGIVSTLAS